MFLTTGKTNSLLIGCIHNVITIETKKLSDDSIKRLEDIGFEWNIHK